MPKKRYTPEEIVAKLRQVCMRVRERVQPGYGDVRDITSRWLGIETDRRIENANAGPVQNLRKLFGTDEFAAHDPSTAIGWEK